MTQLVADHGVWVLGVLCFLSCLILPIPASLAMLAAGGFAAVGQMGVGAVVVAAFVGAVLGDQAGYWVGRYGGVPLVRRLARHRGQVVARAKGLLEQRGAVAVFLTRWLFAPLGPWINFACGAAGMGW
ncbi:MAG: DedA family protein, partial [Paracoccaceae bacterium]